jgi:3-deoxy-D-manno-octulosonic-acid transferase
MRLLYILATWVAFAVLMPALRLFKKTRDGWGQRLGFYAPGVVPEGGGPRIWLHGASAGDLLALSPIIDRLRQRYPDARLLLSTMTNTGFLMARERLSKKVDAVVYVPWDLFGATRRAVRGLRPDMLVLEYTEIWPNLIAAAKASGARVVLTNGRFSPNHLTRYRRFFQLIGNPLAQLDLFLMRSPEEAEHALALGAAKERVLVTGNTKFDALVPAQAEEDHALQLALGLPDGARVLIAGSTHEGEEGLLLDVYQRVRHVAPDLRFVIAPRYIDRAEKVVALATERGLDVARRSEGNPRGAHVVILDSIGELARVYRLGTLVFVGGSFTTRGGQNIL